MEITKHDLEGLLKFLQYGVNDAVVTVNNEYLQEVVIIAIDGLNKIEVKENKKNKKTDEDFKPHTEYRGYLWC